MIYIVMISCNPTYARCVIVQKKTKVETLIHFHFTVFEQKTRENSLTY